MQEKVETIPVMDTLQLEKNKKIKRRAFLGWLVLLFVIIVEISFCVMWRQQQKIADRHMERLLETATLRNAEELTEAEITFLYENYANTTQMTSFKKEREQIFLDRVSGVSGLTIKGVSLTRCQTEDASFLQLCFVCEFEDKISESLLYAYRYYESGMQEKYICYAYDTIKKLEA